MEYIFRCYTCNGRFEFDDEFLIIHGNRIVDEAELAQRKIRFQQMRQEVEKPEIDFHPWHPGELPSDHEDKVKTEKMPRDRIGSWIGDPRLRSYIGSRKKNGMEAKMLIYQNLPDIRTVYHVEEPKKERVRKLGRRLKLWK